MKELQVIGNIGNDATTKDVNGEILVSFSVAVTRKTKETETTDWISVITKQETLAKYLLKGTKVFVRGYFKIGVYDIELLSAKVDRE